ncbi:Non-specific serine/threonine protein kinase [Heracleum sosnowskyi]|uniref:Serine/threonine-protein kinase PRP4 homolog n=1 Tax=Heracleum sosnowskyi TaxID=360622 RepID=A0AAD8I8T5_9APIA|nr:Non-specific serine/threonine protein kinase [Heracleum sosnowskyi]
MAGDPSGAKHRRNSDTESEQPLKRHRRHHHRRHRHRRSRNHDDKDAEIEDVVEEKAQSPPKVVAVDDEVEEGEILEEDEAFVAEKRRLDSSDVESGEIKADADRNEEAPGVELDASTFEGQNVEKVGCHSMMLGVDEVAVDDGDDATLSRKRIINGDGKMCDEIDVPRDSSVERYGKVDISKEKYSKSSRSSTPEGLGKRKGYYIGESERRRQKTYSNAYEGNRHTSMGRSALPGRIREEDRRSSRSRSPDQANEKSRSQSLVEEPSRLQVQQFDVTSNRDIRLPKNFDDETISRYDYDYRHGSRDFGERERSSTYSRHATRDNRYQSSDTRTRFRDKSRESWDRERESRDRLREKVQERARERDRGQEWEREKERERRRERERDGERRKDRHQDVIKDKEYDKFTRKRKHSDANTGYAYGDNYTDNRHQRPDETDDWDKARRSDADKYKSSKIGNSERDVQKERRDEPELENFQENTVLQLAEKEEEEFDRIKEESRKRKQAILEKFKTRQSQQKLEAKMEINGKTSLSDEETRSAQDEAAVTPLVEKSFSVEKSPEQIVHPALKVAGSGALGAGTPKSEGSDDMFRDDIFGDSPTGVRKSEKGDCLLVESREVDDNWDDPEGYYSYRFGEILDARYEVIAAHGKGVFSSVVRAKDLKAGFGDPEEVAIKIIRNNDIMHKAGLEELVILKKLVAADKEDRRHCVRYISSFKYRNHLCLVFESLHMNLREVLKKFGRNIGLKLTAVRTYAKQLFIALKHLRNCGVLHCDIKPDNMLVNDAKNVLKLCDFGNAMFAGKNEVTPYLVSRFYRAPEIILGLQYDHPMDIWSVGCCLYEIYTGKVLFPGPTNNDMLRLHMELKGPFPKKMLRKGAFIDHHFDQDLNFLATEEDPVTKKTMKRLVLNIKPKDIGSIVFGSAGDDPKMLSNFKDLLEKIFVLDPEKRITVSQSLSHPFITGK